MPNLYEYSTMLRVITLVNVAPSTALAVLPAASSAAASTGASTMRRCPPPPALGTLPQLSSPVAAAAAAPRCAAEAAWERAERLSSVGERGCLAARGRRDEDG
jgi:hypothetical protein